MEGSGNLAHEALAPASEGFGVGGSGSGSHHFSQPDGLRRCPGLVEDHVAFREQHNHC